MNSNKIIEIQKEYILIIESLFQKEISEIKNFTTTEEIGKYAAKIKFTSLYVGSFFRKITIFEDKFLKLISALNEHWKKYEVEINEYCQNISPNKVTIWTDTNLSYLTPKLLLYYNTVLIADPIVTHAKSVIEAGNYRDVLWYFSQIMKLKEFLSDNTDIPLIIFFNYKKSVGLNLLEDSSKMAMEYIDSQFGLFAKNAYLKIINEEFEFKDAGDLYSKICQITPKKLNQQINKRLLYKLLDMFIQYPDFLQASRSVGILDFILKERLQKDILISKDYIDIFNILSSAFSISEAREFNAKILNSLNIITDFYLPIAEFKYDKLCKDYGNILEIAENNLIGYSLSQSFTWINQISIEQCIQLRENGAFDDFRNILNYCTNNLKLSSFEDFPLAAKKYEEIVKNEINEQIFKNENRIKKLKSKRNTSIISFGVTAGLTIGSIAFPALLPLTLASAGYGLVAGASAKDLVNELLSGKSELKELGNRSLSVIIKKADNTQYNQ